MSAYCSEMCRSETGQCWFALGTVGVHHGHICSKKETAAIVIQAARKREGRKFDIAVSEDSLLTYKGASGISIYNSHVF